MEQVNLPTYPYTELSQQRKQETQVMLTPQAPPPPVPSATLLLGPENTLTTCTFCSASIKTAVKYTSNTKTHIAAALWCLVCCFCCLPYCSESAKNSDHYCPNCQKYLGTYHK